MSSTELSQFDALKADLTLFVAPTKELRVMDAASNAVATDTLRKVKEFQKKIETKRTELVAPLNTRVKQVNEYAKEISAPLLQAEAHIKKQMGDWATAETERRMAEQRRIEEERRKQEAEDRKKAEAERQALEAKAKEEQEAMVLFGAAPAKADDAAAREKAELEAKLEREQKEREREHKVQLRQLEAERPKNVRQEWRFEITDPAAVPREYLMVDESKVRAAVRAGAREIPGVRIFTETVVVARGA